MNILQIANKALYPPDGGSLAILSLTKSYIKNGHSVHLLNMLTHKHSNKNHSNNEEYKNLLKITGVFINTQINYIKLILNYFFSSKPYISNRFISRDFRDELVSIIDNNSFDLVQIEGLYILQYINTIRENFKGKIIYRSHNIEHIIWQRNYTEVVSISKKVYFKSVYKRLQKLEQKLINTYDYLIPISYSDEDTYKELGNYKPSLTAPFGIDFENLEKEITNPDVKSGQFINYIGALDWIPNQEGLLWFIDNCFPIIIISFPEITLNIAGRNAPEWLKKKLKKKNIAFMGEVDNAYEFFQNPGPLIVPLFSGSGMRVKIIEGMAFKKGIIATDIATEGIKCSNNKHIILANNANDFTKAVISFIENPKLQSRIGTKANEFVKENYDFRKIGANILNFIS